MTEFRLIAVPYEVGAERMGVGRGPERLLEAGAEEALGSRGATVHLDFVELREHNRDESGASEAGAGFELIALVAERVRDAVAEGAFPVLLSGSCFAGLGMVSGLGESSPGVIWFDAHGDFNTPESTIDGYFDGMPVAILTGSAWPSLIERLEVATVPETAVLQVGARDFDPLEERRLESSELVRLPTEEIRADDAVARAVERLAPRPSGLYLHVDLDVLDSNEARVNIYSVDGGLRADQLEAQVRAVLDLGTVRGLSLTAYDPGVDAEADVPPIAIRLLGALAERCSREP
jgi:arginase